MKWARDAEHFQEKLRAILVAVKRTGTAFVREPFATPEFCCECTVKIEENFENLQVIELRPQEVMKRIGERVQAGLER